MALRTTLVSVAVLAASIALTAQQTAASISGHVTDARSIPVSNYSVLVFSANREKAAAAPRVLKLAKPAQDGSFEVADLPPGEYWVAAVDPVDANEGSGELQKPDVLEQLSFRALRVSLTAHQKLLTVLRLIRR